YDQSGQVPYIDLDGTGDYLSRADEAGLRLPGTETYVAGAAQGMTMGIWANFDNHPSQRGIMGKYLVAGNQRSYLMTAEATGVVRFFVSLAGTTSVSLTGTIDTGTDTWRHIVVRFIPSVELAIFVDGVKETLAVGVPASLANTTAAFTIGKFDGGGSSVDGKLSLGFLCATSLPDGLIYALYQSQKHFFGVE
ncbi:MAG: LamG domain-containing protein, partial [Planctomycetes bacterium]|nr:LamG domain-containing protein [Planctomycetota bacterium]